jgi:hypothetical protein
LNPCNIALRSMQWSFRMETVCPSYPILTVILLRDWLSSGRVILNDPSDGAFFRSPGNLWLADRFRGDSFPPTSTLSGQLFHHQMLPLVATPVAINLLGERLNPTNKQRCLLLQAVFRGKCLSHQRCTIPDNDLTPIAVCGWLRHRHRFGIYTLWCSLVQST